MAVQRVLTSVLLAALRTDDVSVLTPEMDVLNVTLQRHLVEVFVTVGTTFTSVPILLGRCGCG